MDENVDSNGIREVADNLSTIFKIKCSIGDYRMFDEKCKLYFGDSRHVMLSTCLRVWESLVPVLASMDNKLDVLTLLTKRVLELEDKVKTFEGKKRRTNDGRIVENEN